MEQITFDDYAINIYRPGGGDDVRLMIFSAKGNPLDMGLTMRFTRDEALTLARALLKVAPESEAPAL